MDVRYAKLPCGTGTVGRKNPSNLSVRSRKHRYGGYVAEQEAGASCLDRLTVNIYLEYIVHETPGILNFLGVYEQSVGSFLEQKESLTLSDHSRTALTPAALDIGKLTQQP